MTPQQPKWVLYNMSAQKPHVAKETTQRGPLHAQLRTSQNHPLPRDAVTPASLGEGEDVVSETSRRG